MKNLIEDQIYAQARQRIGFRIHAAIYVVLIGINWLIWQIFPVAHIWPIWPTMGWGIGLLAHYMGAIGRYTFFSVEDEVNQLKHQQTYRHES